MPKKQLADEAAPLSPKKEAILTVLYRYGDEGTYNLHLLDAIQRADVAVGRKKTTVGTFYPTVKRLEEIDGFIEGFWGKDNVAPEVKRRYLRITQAGIDALISSRQYRLILAGESPDRDVSPLPEPGLGGLAAQKGGVG